MVAKVQTTYLSAAVRCWCCSGCFRYWCAADADLYCRLSPSHWMSPSNSVYRWWQEWHIDHHLLRCHRWTGCYRSACGHHLALFRLWNRRPRRAKPEKHIRELKYRSSSRYLGTYGGSKSLIMFKNLNVRSRFKSRACDFGREAFNQLDKFAVDSNWIGINLGKWVT